ncbi:MAG TPA: vitamin K epoxide reductase family protein [Candidatus Binatia bacterium]|nr:vitamin K epoxide reductase family protein [Candidatus Binatia bacterium]
MNSELTGTGKFEPQRLRYELQQEESLDLSRRRGVIALSLVGMASMTAVTLLQTSIVKHLPDPPVGNFDSDSVNSSDTAYRFGVPDGAISLASLAANIPIAAFGGARRARSQPCVPLLACVKASIEAAAASWYFYQMPAREKAWCGYCVVGALANIGIAALTIPEAKEALGELKRKSFDRSINDPA